MTDRGEKIIPPQIEGGKKDIGHTVQTINDDDARKLFVIARNRLLDVNNWHKLAGAASATFTLVDSHGHNLNRMAGVNDYIKIDLPGPGPAEGDGYDWVLIEAIEDNSNSTGRQEKIAMKVRPASPPLKGEKVAHFFKDKATSTFMVERNGKVLTAAEFGRNEVPNTAADKLTDKVRNAIVGVTAIAGASNVQWKALMKGLIAPDK